MRFRQPLKISGTALRDALLKAQDPLAIGRHVYVYFQRGHIVEPSEVRLSGRYCHIAVDPWMIASEVPPERLGEVFPASGTDVVVSTVLRQDADAYAVGRGLVPGEERKSLGPEYKWSHDDPARRGRAIDLRMRTGDGNAVSSIVCFKQGTADPTQDDVAYVLRNLAAIVPPPVVAKKPVAVAEQDATGGSVSELKDAAPKATAGAQAQPKAETEVQDPDEFDEPAGPRRDALKEYEEALARKKTPQMKQFEVAIDKMLSAAATDDGSLPPLIDPNRPSAPAPKATAPVPHPDRRVQVCEVDAKAAAPQVVCRIGDKPVRTLSGGLLSAPLPGSPSFASAAARGGCDFSTPAGRRATVEKDLMRLALGGKPECTELYQPCINPDELNEVELARLLKKRRGTATARASRSVGFKLEEELPLCHAPTPRAKPPKIKAAQMTAAAVAIGAPPVTGTEPPLLSSSIVSDFGKHLRAEYDQSGACPASVRASDFEILMSDPRLLGSYTAELKALEVGSSDIPAAHLAQPGVDAGLARLCTYNRDMKLVETAAFHCHGMSCFEQIGKNYDCAAYETYTGGDGTWQPTRTCDDWDGRTEKLRLVALTRKGEVWVLVRYLRVDAAPEYGLIFPRKKK